MTAIRKEIKREKYQAAALFIGTDIILSLKLPG